MCTELEPDESHVFTQRWKMFSFWEPVFIGLKRIQYVGKITKLLFVTIFFTYNTWIMFIKICCRVKQYVFKD